MTAQAGAVAALVGYTDENADFLLPRPDGCVLSARVDVLLVREPFGKFTTPLYTAPPAAVPVEALEGLALAWEAEAHSDRINSGHCAYALRQLIKERSNG